MGIALGIDMTDPWVAVVNAFGCRTVQRYSVNLIKIDFLWFGSCYVARLSMGVQTSGPGNIKTDIIHSNGREIVGRIL